MIYVDTSVLLAQLLSEDRRPPPGFWSEVLISSRLAEYELWTRVNARALGQSHGELARALLARLSFLELAPNVLARAFEPFPTPVRTLDALHLASVDYLRERRQNVELATYDRRMAEAGRELGFAVYSLDG